MNLKHFTDLIETLGKVAGELKAIANLSIAKRKKYRQMIDETEHLLDRDRIKTLTPLQRDSGEETEHEP